MRKQLLSSVLTLIFVVCAVGTAQAKSWRINNNSALKPHFTSINEAMSSDEVQDGDTLYLDPGCSLSSNQTVSKAVIVVGAGYFLNALPYNEASVSGTMTLSAENCKIMGLSMGVVSVSASNVTLERCRINQVKAYNSTPQNVLIRQCFLTGSKYITGYSSSSYNKYWTIENCIMSSGLSKSGDTFSLGNLFGAIIRNNIIIRDEHNTYIDNYVINYVENCEITNNIIINRSNYASSNYSGTSRSSYVLGGNIANCTITNNVFERSSYSEYPNNKYSVTLSSIFSGTYSTATSDTGYKLSSSSPAKGYATDGGDCGPYGSGYTYVPSGLPFGHPYYTQIQVGSPAQNGKLNVTYKVKVQDE